MNARLLTQVAEAAKRDGLTLTWSLIRLAEKLEQDLQQEADGDEADALSRRLDAEALASVLMAAIKAYPSGAGFP